MVTWHMVMPDPIKTTKYKYMKSRRTSTIANICKKNMKHASMIEAWYFSPYQFPLVEMRNWTMYTMSKSHTCFNWYRMSYWNISNTFKSYVCNKTFLPTPDGKYRFIFVMQTSPNGTKSFLEILWHNVDFIAGN